PQAAWTFTTLDIGRHVTELWNTPYDQNLPLTVYDAHVENAAITLPNLSKVVTGKLMTYERLDPVTRAFGAEGRQRKVDFLLTLPKGASAKTKVVVFGHGLYTARTLGIMIADRLGRSGFATIS